MPHATASPCSSTLYAVSASSACPIVWPRFSTCRNPPSRSSALTTDAFRRTESAITFSTTTVSRSRISLPFSSSLIHFHHDILRHHAHKQQSHSSDDDTAPSLPVIKHRPHDGDRQRDHCAQDE